MDWKKPGLWDGVPPAEYHAWEALSSSCLRAMLDCPAAYRWERDHPDEVKDTEATAFGSAAHCYLLENKEFHKRYFITEAGFIRARKEDKALAEAEEKAGKTQIKRGDYDLVRELADAVMAFGFASKIVAGAEARERTAVAAVHGLPAKIRTDFDAVSFCGTIADLKVTVNSHPDDWAAHVHRMGGIIQAALYPIVYSRASEAAGRGECAPDFAWIVAPNERPFAGRVWVAVPTDRWIERATDDITTAIEIYKKCLETKKWPGYSDDKPRDIEPRWFTRE